MKLKVHATVSTYYWLRSSLLEKQGTCKSLGSQMPLNPLHVLPFSNTGFSPCFSPNQLCPALMRF
ncbi:hypothetical protein GYH30_054172 [Glycine max]|nr:hypothetical protein GYH30_054172 [Glycine max]